MMTRGKYRCHCVEINEMEVRTSSERVTFELQTTEESDCIHVRAEDIPRLIAQLTAAQGGLHVSHSQTISTRGPDVVAVPLSPVVYTLDEFQKAIESLRKDGA